MNSNLWVLALRDAISVGVPIALCAVGLIINEKAGVLNLGAEGMMLIGAVAAFLSADAFHNPWLALVCAMLAGALLALIHGFLCVTLRANQIVAGLALTLFGVGLSTYLGESVAGDPRGAKVVPFVGGLADLPLVGPIVFGQNVLVYATVAAAIGVAWFLGRTRAGLELRAVGESPASADSQGLSVTRVRYLAVLAGGVFAGSAGAYQMLVKVPSWSQAKTTNGLGWIALALVVFSGWRPTRALVGAALFGFALRANGTLQALRITAVPGSVLSMLPYVLTMVVLIVQSTPRARRSFGAPTALGTPFVRDER